MQTEAVREITESTPLRRMAPFVYWIGVFFFLSGISGLMYEVVWVRMLTRILGNTVFATSTVLAAFMAGLAVGSLVVGRFIDRVGKTLLVYCVLELGIGLSALLTLEIPGHLVPLYRLMYDLAGESRAGLTVCQVCLAFLVLFLPTTLMGATLPTLCAFATRQLQGIGRSAGTFYALNTLGGVVGVMASGFVLVGLLGERGTVLVGVVLNVAAGLGTLLVLRHAAHQYPAADDGGGTIEPLAAGGDAALYSNRVRWTVMVSFALSGFAALANEVAWSRLLTLYQGTSIYAFSGMLGVMLGGMGLGSLWVSRSIDRWPDPLRTLARLELAIGLVGALSLHLFGVMRDPARTDPLSSYSAQFFRLLFVPALVVGPLGLLWGAIFPVSVRCYTRSVSLTGRNTSELYGWNTVGCIAGPLLAGFLLIPWFGTSTTAVIVAGVSLTLGAVLLAVHPQGLGFRVRWPDWILLALGAFLLMSSGDPYYERLRRRMERVYPGEVQPYRHIEEAAGTTTAFGSRSLNSREKMLWVNGEGMTALVTETKLMAHLPISMADQPRKVLVICFGMGTTLRSASRYEELEVWTVEMMPGVLKCFDYFHPDGAKVLGSERIHAVADDGRNFLLLHRENFDVITIDPAPPLHSAGTVNLYSREFFELCQSRLNPGGVLCLWIPPANYTEVKMILRTFMEVFEYVTVWSGRQYPGLYLIGTRRTVEDIPDRIRNMYQRQVVVDDLTEWDDSMNQPEKMLSLLICGAEALKPILVSSAIVTDNHPYTEFPLWRSVFDAKNFSRRLDGRALRTILGGVPGNQFQKSRSDTQ